MLHILYLDIEYNIKFQTILGPRSRTVLPLCKTYSKDRRLCVVCKSFSYQARHRRIQRGGGGGGQGVRNTPPHWNCQIISFCHVDIFRQTPSGNLDPFEKIFWIRACTNKQWRKKLLAFVILLASRKCLVTHAEVCICTSSQTRYIASTPTPGVHHAEKMWVNTVVMISPTHKFAIILL